MTAFPDYKSAQEQRSQAMSDELKPCQHCTSSLGPFVAAPDGKRQVICSTCGTRGPYETMVETAESLWNRRQTPWKPIATAPKDGTLFLGKCGRTVSTWWIVDRPEKRKTVKMGVWPFRRIVETVERDAGLYLENVTDGGGIFYISAGRRIGLDPTHWREMDFGDGKPMPDAPEVTPMTPAQAAWLRKLKDEGPQGTFHLHGTDLTEIDACQRGAATN